MSDFVLPSLMSALSRITSSADLTFDDSAWRRPKCTHLLRQQGFVAARTRAEGLAAADEDAGATGTVAGAAAALLVAELLTGAIDFAAGLCLMRAGLTLVQLPLDNAMKNIGARLETENLRIKIERAGVAGFDRANIGFNLGHRLLLRRRFD